MVPSYSQKDMVQCFAVGTITVHRDKAGSESPTLTLKVPFSSEPESTSMTGSARRARPVPVRGAAGGGFPGGAGDAEGPHRAPSPRRPPLRPVGPPSPPLLKGGVGAPERRARHIPPKHIRTKTYVCMSI